MASARTRGGSPPIHFGAVQGADHRAAGLRAHAGFALEDDEAVIAERVGNHGFWGIRYL